VTWTFVSAISNDDAMRQLKSAKRSPTTGPLTSCCRKARRNAIRVLGSAGFVCLLIMVLTHVAEAWRVLPGMGWGLPNSPGHYLDLFSAISGVVLLLAAYVLRRRIFQTDRCASGLGLDRRTPMPIAAKAAKAAPTVNAAPGPRADHNPPAKTLATSRASPTITL
jgi:hypothetical protein